MLYKYGIQPKLENRQSRGVKQGEKVHFFLKYTLILTLTLLTDVLERQIEWVLLVENESRVAINKSLLPISSPITLSLCFLSFDWPGLACLLNSVCCGSILQSSRLRILALFHFFSLEMFSKIKYRRNRVWFGWPQTTQTSF